MATTALSILSNRFRNRAYLQASVSSVALDAVVNELFTLPQTPVFGQFLLERMTAVLGSLSGAYVAPSPAYDGFEVYVLSQDQTTRQDTVGAARFVNVLTSSARPQLAVTFDLVNGVLVRQSERIAVTGPILAGAGVTGSLLVGVAGIRFDTA